MQCPRHNAELTKDKERGIEVDRCPECKGVWLTRPELFQLEATVARDDALAGTIDYSKRASELACPMCGKAMVAFNYRAYNLELDACDEHGFWLDAGEEQRLLEIMRERARDLRRAASAEAAWGQFVRGLGRRSFWHQVGDLFRGGRR